MTKHLKLAVAPEAAPGTPRRRYRALFVSDLHLGDKGADIRALNGLLAAVEVEQLYLVGDVLDGWKLAKRWHWTQEYCTLIDQIMALRRRRVRITLLTGNHDDTLRELLPRLMRPVLLRRFGIRIEERCLHRTARGERLLVMHGDGFDGLVWRGSSKMADRAWLWLTERGLVPPPRPERRWSLGRAIVREGGTLAERYAATALRHVAGEGLDGIVFGHSHIPLLERRQGRLLANCGAWTLAAGGAHTAIAEAPDGRLELLRWPATAAAPEPAGTPLRLEDPDSLRLIRLIHALWRPAEAAAGLFPAPVMPAGRRPALLPETPPGLTGLPA